LQSVNTHLINTLQIIKPKTQIDRAEIFYIAQFFMFHLPSVLLAISKQLPQLPLILSEMTGFCDAVMLRRLSLN